MTLTLSSAGRRYGYLKDRPDHRDLGIASSPITAIGLDPSVDLESFCGPVLDQGDEGSCAGQFGAEVRQFLRKKLQAADDDFSPAYIYWLARQMDAFWSANNRWPTNAELLEFTKTIVVTLDTGTYGRTVCRVLNQFGACTRATMPYVAGDFATGPTDAQFAEGLTFKAGAYHRIPTVQDMKTCLASGYAFGIGFTVYSSFEGDQVAKDGLWSPDKSSEDILGGHEVMAIGYDDSVNGGSFKVRNSWSASWGAAGNFWMRYQDAADSDILQDAWMIHLGKAWAAK